MIIALHSRGNQAGKDTVADFIREWCEQEGHTYERRAFADPMKLLVAANTGTLEELSENTHKLMKWLWSVRQ
jgi:hypothetical protein